MTAESGDGGGPDLLAGVPGDRAAASDPARLDELLAAVRAMGERLAALETAASERPGAATREELDAWGERLLKKLGETAAKGTGTDAAAVAEHAGRTAAAAERIDAGLERTAERFSAEVAGVEKWLSEDRSSIRAPLTGIESAAGRIEAGLGELRNKADTDFNGLFRNIHGMQDRLEKLQFRWQVFFSPWAIGMFIAGMAFATSLELADRLLS